jgi:hypothetical protein
MTDSSSNRVYLTLKPLTLLEVPPHPDFEDDASEHIELEKFLNKVFQEAAVVGFDEGWKSHGRVDPTLENDSKVDMPSYPNTTGDGTRRNIPTNVERRSKRINNKIWLARRSHHHRHDVYDTELDKLLAQGR